LRKSYFGNLYELQKIMRKIKSWIKQYLCSKNTIPSNNIPMIFPVGHFYSPIADPEDISARMEQIWNQSDSMVGIDLNVEYQLSLLKELKPYVCEIDYPVEQPVDEPHTYFYKNDQFPCLDAEFLFTMLCHFKPRRIIEVGSGFSSLITADVNQRQFIKDFKFSCIEPFPRQFLLDGVDGIDELIVEKVENVDHSIFDNLESGDVLFIDSSHVSKVGSDVNHLYFEVIPRLKFGVIVHIHDIFLPDEYPKKWVIDEGRNWNEQYLLRSFLQFNESFEILWAAHFMGSRYQDEVVNTFPRCIELGKGGSMWLRRIK
jgi:hypothetical protein